MIYTYYSYIYDAFFFIFIHSNWEHSSGTFSKFEQYYFQQLQTQRMQWEICLWVDRLHVHPPCRWKHSPVCWCFHRISFVCYECFVVLADVLLYVVFFFVVFWCCRSLVLSGRERETSSRGEKMHIYIHTAQVTTQGSSQLNLYSSPRSRGGRIKNTDQAVVY